MSHHAFNATYRGAQLDRIAFPLGGIGAGMVCLEGTGALSHVSLRHRPEVFHEPAQFAALHVAGQARVIEAPVPLWKAFGPPGTGNGAGGKTFGLPRFAAASFTTRFPFATLELSEPSLPVAVSLTGWSPFTPGCADDSSLPAAGLEYRLTNTSSAPVEAVFSYHAVNFMRTGNESGAVVCPLPGGFLLSQPPVDEKPWDEGHFAAFLDEEDAKVDCGWFRGGWFDPLTMIWNSIARGEAIARPPHPDSPGGGASLYLPLTLQPGESRTVRLHLAWYVPASNLRIGADLDGDACGCDDECRSYKPWYAARFGSTAELAAYWRAEYDRLRAASEQFADCFYDTTLPPEAVEAVAANLTILKSPTCLRQHDGRFWAWEGCSDGSGCCHGTCTHVWNYAQALCHLFPDLERTLRETEFRVSQSDAGHQSFRTSLPIRDCDHGFHAAADGQLGGILKVHREWRISGDTGWLEMLWPKVRQSLDYCIETWDPDHTGTLLEPHHNTYDIEFWGADGMCTSFYLGALQAAIAMGTAVGDGVELYQTLLQRGLAAMRGSLWNGEFYIQRIQWSCLHADDPTQVQTYHGGYSAEALELLRTEGPKYQYGEGCLSDGVLGEFMVRTSGLPPVLDEEQCASHLAAVYRHNFRASLASHANPQRPSFAFGQEGGLLLCSWPHGGKLSLPFPYSDEVWTGIEYQAAAHMILCGLVDEGLAVVRAVRQRYDGRVRNPFNEVECGHWYARAMSSYALLQALGGAWYDAVDKVLHLTPALPGDYRAFLCTATGYGTVGVKDGRPFVEVASGMIPVSEVRYVPAVGAPLLRE